MRILLLSQFFDPEPTFKGLQFAKALQRRGHTVEALTGFPNYPGGKLYPGFELSLYRTEVMEGIPVSRVCLYPSHDKSAIGRSANYLSFGASATIAALTRKPDVVYAYHPPATAALPAVALRRLRGVPYVLDVQDLWPDTIGATGMLSSSAPIKALGALAATTYRYATRVVAQSPGFRRTLMERGVPSDKLDVVYNWADERVYSALPPRGASPDGRLNVLFAGAMGVAQGLDTVLEAASLAREALPSVHFTFVGEGTERQRLISVASARGLDNVTFLPRREPSAMPALMAEADLLLVHLKDHPLFRITIPSKIQAYLAVGRPTLAALNGDAADLVERSGGGIACAPSDPSVMLSAIGRFAGMSSEARAAMGLAGRRFYESQLALRIGVEHFERIFQAAVGSSL